MKEKRDDKAEREEQLRRRFENQLRPLTKSLDSTGAKRHIELPKTLNPYERAIAHEVATALGLKHESRGVMFALEAFLQWPFKHTNIGLVGFPPCFLISSPPIPPYDTFLRGRDSSCICPRLCADLRRRHGSETASVEGW